MDMALLSIDALQVRYGGTLGTRQVSFDIAAGETVALVGSNGAGKSSTLKAIMGLVGSAKGQITFDGKPIVGCKPSEIVRHGIGYSPEGRRVFSTLSVLENLRMGAFTRPRQDAAERLEQMLDCFPRLRERANQRASSLSGGEQQMLAIGRALMSRPRLFLLDEPSLGLAPIIVTRIGEILLEIQAREGLAVVLAEQNADWAMQVAKRAVILELGTCIADGSCADLRRDPRVQAAYLGL
jgi:branched-chain amino acid transport system ATP-binding protein